MRNKLSSRMARRFGRVCRDLGAVILLLAQSLAWPVDVSAAANAGTERHQMQANGVTLEITALRDDIIRVRAGAGALPEDASWAVMPAVRRRAVPLTVTEEGSDTVLRTQALVVRVDRASLHVRVEDAAGQVLLADAGGRSLVFDGLDVPGATGVHLRKVMPADVHYFGLGDKTGPLDRRGEAFVLWNSDAGGFGESTDPLYKAIPFVLGVSESGVSFGLFFDNTWRSYFDFGKRERDTLSFGSDGGPVDYYVMGAPQPKGVVQAYAFLTGLAPLPPMWALGFQQSRYSYGTDVEARAIATRLREDRIPSDVLYLDIDYQDRNRPFSVSREAFPDLPRFIADLRAMDLRVVLITDLHIADAPEEHYPPYDSGAAAGVFLRRPDGAPYVADVWPGKSVFPDFSREPVRRWWGGLYADFVRAGAAGFWNDMNEPAIFHVREKTLPLDTVHRIEEEGFAPRDATHAEMHNVYGQLNSRATFEGLLRLRSDRRPFVLTRATYAGGQRYAATWTGDNTSSWNHLRLSIPMLNNLGLSGFGYAGDDVGGFEGAGPSSELLTRWIEIGAFNPLFRDHAAKGKPAQEPWAGGTEQEAIRRRYIEERYRLMPYLYGLAEENSRTGLPLMRPVFLEYPSQLAKDGVLGGSGDQFMLGGDLLIAPAPAGESPAPYDIRLPGAGWYDYWSGERLSSADLVETPRLERLPVFVRPGAILARQPLVQSTAQRPVGALQLSVYPGPDCRADLYFDDGVSFAYKRGVYLRQQVECQADAHGISIDFGPRQGHYPPWWRELRVDVHGVSQAPGRVLLGRTAVASQFDKDNQVLNLRLPDIVTGARAIIEFSP